VRELNNDLLDASGERLAQEGGRARWENIRRLAVNAFMNLTWDQAQQYLIEASQAAQHFVEMEEMNWAEIAFIEHMNWRILEKNAEYSAALREFFESQQGIKPER
jgi:hypothetical protein